MTMQLDVFPGLHLPSKLSHDDCIFIQMEMTTNRNTLRRYGELPKPHVVASALFFVLLRYGTDLTPEHKKTEPQLRFF